MTTTSKLVRSTNVYGPQNEGRDLTVRWYEDGSIRIVFKGTGPVVVDELHIAQAEPMIRVRSAKSVIAQPDSTTLFDQHGSS